MLYFCADGIVNLMGRAQQGYGMGKETELTKVLVVPPPLFSQVHGIKAKRACQGDCPHLLAHSLSTDVAILFSMTFEKAVVIFMA